MSRKTGDKTLEFNSFLILFGFYLFVSILHLIKTIAKSVIMLTINDKPYYNSAIFIDIFNLFLLILTIFLFFKKKKLFLYIIYTTLSVSTLSNLYLLIVNKSYLSIFIIVKISISISLLLYFTKSKNVKKTFVN